MDRLEAIKRLETLVEVWDGEPFVKESVEAYKVAIAALREQEQREQGCEYCNEYKSIVEENGDFISLDETRSKGVFLEACTCDVLLEVKVPFCPMCGRKLGGAEE